MKDPIYIHYGATTFNPKTNFPIRNRNDWTKPRGGLWASREMATFGWKEWCEQAEYCDCKKEEAFKFILKDGAKVAVISNMTDLRRLPTTESDVSVHWTTLIDFEECLRQGIDAIELCWYGDEYEAQKSDDMYFGLYAWDCDSIIILNPEVVIQI